MVMELIRATSPQREVFVFAPALSEKYLRGENG